MGTILLLTLVFFGCSHLQLFSSKYWTEDTLQTFCFDAQIKEVCHPYATGILVFLKRFICLVEVHYHKLNLNSDNKMFLHVGDV